jgi:hypothetical protein
MGQPKEEFTMKKIVFLLVLVLILSLSACKLPAPGGDNLANATATAAAQSTAMPTTVSEQASPTKAATEKVEPTSTPNTLPAVTATPAPPTPTSAQPEATATAQPQVTNSQAMRVSFEAGSDTATLTGVLNGGQTLVYVLAAKKDQTMQADVWSPNGDVYLGVSGASSGQVFVSPSDKKTTWGGVLPMDQDYYVSVTAGGGQTSYTLTVRISPAAGGATGGTTELFDPYATYGEPDYEDLMVGGSLMEWAPPETGKLPDNNVIKLDFKDGKLYVTGKIVDFSTWWFTWHTLKDAYLEMSIDSQSCLGSDTYGMIIRGPEHDAGQSYGYVVAFSCDGYFWVFRLDDADPWTAHDLISWTKSDAIKTGSQVENLVAVRAEGETLTIFANGRQIAQVTDDEYSQGRFGVFVRSSEDGDYTYRVKKIAYWVLGEEEK